MLNLKVVNPLAISTAYGNTFDIRDSLFNTSIGQNHNNMFISFYNDNLGYVIEYFFCSNSVYMEGCYDEDYWNDDKINEITEVLTNYNDNDFPNYSCKEEPDIKLEEAITYLLEEMDKYSEYLIYDKFVETVLYNANMENTGYVIDKDNSDLDRLFFTMDNQEYTIRMWNICSCGKVDYTLYKTVEDHGETIGRGIYIIR